MSYSNAKELINLLGWHTKRKLVVFESDDWGSIRIPSRHILKALEAKGIDFTTGDSGRYNYYDSLASEQDLDMLFSTLRGFKDQRGNHPVFTAVSLTANPNFEMIEASRFEEYHCELFTDTLKRYYPNQHVFHYWQQGLADKIFVPQFHGREHLQVNAWMRALQENDRETYLGFKAGLWGYNNKHPHQLSYQAAFDLEKSSDLETHAGIIKDGLRQFELIHGYRASFFVPPNGILSENLYETSRNEGIEFLYSARMHPVPVSPGNFKKRFNYLGRKNKSGQLYIIRNAFFEPSLGIEDVVPACLKQIESAFRWNKPAVISTHRVNFIGAHDEKNRNKGNSQLKQLLSSILKRWPEVEFVTSVELGELMKR